MKVWIILLSLLAATGAGVWGMRRLAPTGRRPRHIVSILARSIAVGVVVYFVFMGIALVYLMLTHQGNPF